MNGAIANSSHEESLKNEISELKSMISKLSPPPKIKTETKKDKVEQKIRDGNFSIIFEMRDKLQEIFDNNHETLSQRPNAEMVPLLDLIKSFTTEYEDFVSEKAVVEGISDSINQLSKSYIKFYTDILNVITLFKITDILTSSQIGIIDKIETMDHAKPISQAEAIEILEPSLDPIKRYSSDAVRKLVNDIIAISSKSSFEDKPNIPSYFLFNTLNCASKMLSTKYESLILSQKPFSREFESLIYAFEKLVEELAYLEKADKTAPNTIAFFAGFKKSISDSLSELKKISKSWDSYFEAIKSLNNQLTKIIESALSSKKDLKILDYLPEN